MKNKICKLIGGLAVCGVATILGFFVMGNIWPHRGWDDEDVDFDDFGEEDDEEDCFEEDYPDENTAVGD